MVMGNGLDDAFSKFQFMNRMILGMHGEARLNQVNSDIREYKEKVS